MMWALITANYQIVALLLIALVVIAELVRRGSPELILDALFVCLAVTRPSFAAAGMLIAQYTIRRLPILARGCAGLIGRDLPPLVLQLALPGALPRAADADHPIMTPTIVLPQPRSAARQTAQTQQTQPARPPVQLPAVAWWPVVQDHPDSIPHCLVLGPSGKGKSWLMEALARTRDGQVVIIQPNKRETDWQGCSVVQCADDGSYTSIARTIEWVRGEFTRRGGAMKLGDPGPWLTIVWDELPLCIGQLGELARRMIIDLLSAGRPRKMRVLGGSNSETVKAIGIEGYGDLLQSCAVIRIGTFAVAKVPEVEPLPWPSTLEVDGRLHVVDRSAVPQLLRTPLPPSRVIDLAAVCLGTLGGARPDIFPGASVSDRQTDAEEARRQRIERYVGMRAMGYEREKARERLKDEGGSLDNNEWSEAGKLLDQQRKAPKQKPAPTIVQPPAPSA